ncbi:MAG: hypothetical protein NVS4B12_24450 [Ktedonobacteraceae bacterium]
MIEQHRQEMAILEIGEDTPNYDMDTWEAYQQVQVMWKQHR